MNALRIRKTIDEATAQAVPELRPLVGKSVELIVVEGAVEPGTQPRLTVEQFLALRRPRPPSVPPVSLDDMEQAIAEGAARGAGV